MDRKLESKVYRELRPYNNFHARLDRRGLRVKDWDLGYDWGQREVLET